MADLGWGEILLVAVVFVLLFGAKRLPDTARAVGRSLRIFKAEMNPAAALEEQARRLEEEAARLRAAGDK
ncbi:twin-arginine translocase TatA/TatE family subunit [Nonomuraea sp. NPDC050536]|uniref:twin-arginine translocase TatA/TatE family subunit n=1 Tax=Nonomuraea sp. NPDC050536 TaxID=3364366 RepID=UPI0037C507FF